jgi:threonine aldolase
MGIVLAGGWTLVVSFHGTTAVVPKYGMAAIPNSLTSLQQQDPPAPLVRLQDPHPFATPTQRLRQLAQVCDTEGIDTWDVYGDYKRTLETSLVRRLEYTVAHECGMADAVWVPSGIMAQSIALLIHARKYHQRRRQHTTNDANIPPSAFACHATSHLLLHEHDAYRHLLHMEAVVVPHQRELSVDTAAAANNVPTIRAISYEDVVAAISNPTSNAAPVTTVLVELPLREIGGKCTSWDDLQELHDYCRHHGISMHCDGARLWESMAYYGTQKRSDGTWVTIQDVCGLFDSVYVSLYKGLGGLSGALLLGSTEFCKEARVWLRRMGGNVYTLLPYAVAGWYGYQQHVQLKSSNIHDKTKEDSPLLSFVEKRNKLAHIVQRLQSIPEIHRVVHFDPAVPQVNMVHGYLRHDTETLRHWIDQVAQATGILVLSRVRPASPAARAAGYASQFEWTLGSANGAIDETVFVQGWLALAALMEQRNDG